MIFEFAPVSHAGVTTKTTRKKKYMILAEMTGNVHVGLAFAGTAIATGLATGGGLIAMSRNPGMFGRILMFMFIGIALAEAWAIFAWFLIK